jgi:hypothetical protein
MQELLNLGSDAIKQLTEVLDLIYMIMLLFIAWYSNVLLTAKNHVPKINIKIRSRWIVIIVGIVWGIIYSFFKETSIYSIFISFVTMLVLNEYFGLSSLLNKWLKIKKHE